jgi:hypothetical protein
MLILQMGKLRLRKTKDKEMTSDEYLTPKLKTFNLITFQTVAVG